KSAPAAIEARPLGSAPPPAAAAGADGVKISPKGVRVPYSDKVYAQMATLSPAPPPAVKAETAAERPEGAKDKDSDDLEWGWPTSGRIVGAFNDGSSKGIAIAGKLGQPVVASAAGRVIFSGVGIRGFGKLIVIKHNNTFLSVYAHNSELLVKEGQTVAKGQKIAEMGNTDTDQVKLHFEIRRLGKPVDPVKLLPERPG
ncbi:MAG: peptidoglycan DD-metalloendopeptidase family protein, partial [Burkholderiales bacterium]